MKCPHCEKEIVLEHVSAMRQEEVYEEICKEKHSIASLSKKLEINRGTIRFYISKLLEQNRIKKERLNNLAGRPVVLMKNDANCEVSE